MPNTVHPGWLTTFKRKLYALYFFPEKANGRFDDKGFEILCNTYRRCVGLNPAHLSTHTGQAAPSSGSMS